MHPTLDWLEGAEKQIRLTLEQLRPKLLETQGNIDHKLKDDKTAVTEMDLMVENRLKSILKNVDASIPFCGEETGVDYSQPTYWLVDPIDGTEPFIRGIPVACNMVALIDNGQPVMGIIYNFFLGDYYLAIKGHGATCNGHPIKVSQRGLEQTYASISRTKLDDPATEGFLDELRRFMHGGVFFNVGSTGYVLSAIANGSMELRINYKSKGKPWDIAAGALLIQEAGGRVANHGSSDFDCQNTEFIASNAVIFDDVAKFMNDFIASH